MIPRLWRSWVTWCGREEDLRPQTWVRILVPLTILLDQANVLRLGLLPWFVVPWSAGGLSSSQDPMYVMGHVMPAEVAGYVTWTLMIVSLLLVLFGIANRPACLIAVLSYAQLGHLHPGGDRAIDRILRMVLLIWMFSDAGSGRPTARMGKAWPADFIRFLLVIIYLAAGIGKVAKQPGWLTMVEPPVLYRVVTDPMAAHMDAVALEPWFPVLHFFGLCTIALELSAPLLLTRFAPWWALCGAGMHIGIFLTMDLGMFSWGMLALYPLLFAPWIVGRRHADGAR